jgi:hypothetical protein
MKFVVFELSTGKITQTGECPDFLYAVQQVPDGCKILPISADATSEYIDNDTPVPFPPKPSEYCIFDYDTKEWVDPRTPETQWPIVRAERNQKLQTCDWTQLSDIPAETKALWEPYRQELRDITDQPDPFNIIWPTPPQ